MIKSLYIDNFKALNNFTISLKPLTVLIGGNACGKSTILQVIQLIAHLVKADVETFIKSRNWNIGEIRSQLNSNQNVILRPVFEFKDSTGKPNLIEWEFVFRPVLKDNKINIIRERVVNLTTKTLLLEVSGQQIIRYNAKSEEKEKIPPLNLSASFIKNIDESKEIEKYPFLVHIKKFLMETDAFDLLLPGKLSQNSRGEVDSIGSHGENIAAFIHGLNKQQKSRITERLKKYSGFFSHVNTKREGQRWGWIKLSASEKFLNHQPHIPATHLSDGVLRIIAIASIIEIDKKNGMVLLEEIENGINPHITEILSDDLQEMTQKGHRQLVLTTHNSVLLDYFPEDSIVFLWRDDEGQVQCSDMFSAKPVREYLEYMHPGEVWLNMDTDVLVEHFKENDKCPEK